MRRWAMISAVLLSLLCLSLDPDPAWGQRGGAGRPTQKKKKKEEKKTAKVTTEATNLDEEQLEALKSAGVMFRKLFGHAEELDDEDKQKLLDTVWRTVNGTFAPSRIGTNEFGRFLMASLQGQILVAEDAKRLLSQTAEVLAAEEKTRETMDTYRGEIQKVFDRSSLDAEAKAKRIEELEKLINDAKKNEEKIKQREAKAKREAELKAKEEARKKKEEERKKNRGVGGVGGIN